LGSIGQFNAETGDWTLYQEQLDQFLEINKIKAELRKAALISNIGQDTYKLLRNLCIPALPGEKSYDELCAVLTKHFSPKINVFRERNKFYSAKQEDTESVSNFFARIKQLSINCHFNNLLEGILLDKFVFGLKQGKVKDRSM